MSNLIIDLLKLFTIVKLFLKMMVFAHREARIVRSYGNNIATFIKVDYGSYRVVRRTLAAAFSSLQHGRVSKVVQIGDFLEFRK